MSKRGTCTAPGCRRASVARGLCRMHYDRTPARRAAKKRSRQSGRGRALLAAAGRRYRQSAKGKAYYKLRLWRYHNDPKIRESWKASARRYRHKASKQRSQRLKEWLKNTTKGREYLRRHSFKLPSNAPKELIRAFELVRNLKKEMKHEHQRT